MRLRWWRGTDDRKAAARLFRRRRWRGRFSRLKLVLVGLLLVVVVAAGAWLLMFSSVLGVRQVAVAGTHGSSVDRVRTAADVRTGQPLARVDLRAIADRVAKLRFVAHAEVTRAWPHGVQITIQRRVAVAAVRQGGRWQAMDGSGVLFRTLSNPARLPQITAEQLPSADDPDALSQAAGVLATLSPRVAHRVDHVQVQSRDNITLVLRNGDQVAWGGAEQSHIKAVVLQALLHARPGVRHYDVSVPAQPTTSS